MKKIYSLILALSCFFILQKAEAQISTIVNVQDVSCAGDSNGQIELTGVEGCFAPLSVQYDSLPPMVFNTLKNDGHKYINHGTGTGFDVGLGAASASTSIGDVYMMAGVFSDSISFDSITLYNSGEQSGFVACFDAATIEVLWADAATAGSGTYVQNYAVAIAGDKAFVVGYLEGTTQFGGATVVSSGGYQGFIAKYDIPTGDIDTVLQVGNTGADECVNIRTGDDGRLYVTGDFTGSITLAGNTFSSNGSYDLFVTCFDTSLTQNYWATTAGGGGIDVANDVVPYTVSGTTMSAYAVGYFISTASFGSNNITSAGQEDFFVAKCDTLGNWIWAESGGGTLVDNSTSIDINSTGDRLYMAGTWRGTMTFDGQNFVSNGNTDGFIAYLDTNGTLADLYEFGGSGADGIYDLQSIDDDYLVWAGAAAGNWTYADSNFASNGSTDAFAAKIGPDMHEIWGKNLGSSNGEAYNSISAGPGTNMHCAGFIAGNASAYQTGLTAVGVSDAIVTNEVFSGIADTTLLLTGLSGGEYYFILSDSNGNTIIDTIVVGEPDALNIAGTVTNASSGTSNDGAIDLTVTGGTPGYSYSWSNSETTEDIVNLGVGTFTVTVTDSNGCIDSASFVIDTGTVEFNVSVQVTHVSCGGADDGAIDLTVTGGTSPYTYNWSTGDTSQDLTGIAGGTYFVTVTDSDTNSYIDSFVVNEPPILVVSETITPPSSGTASDGAIDLTVSGGTPGYSFQWSNGATSEDITGLPIGSYSVTVTDSIGCTFMATYPVDTIPALGIVLTATDVTCINNNNGTIDLVVIGGVPPYTYAWSNGSTTEDQSGLAAGTYTVTVTDSVAQTLSDAATVGSNPIHPAPTVGPITGASSAQAWTVFNYQVPATSGSAFTWTALGGLVTSSSSNAATIQWNAGPSGTIYVNETDANGCTGSDSMAVSILFVGIDETHENTIQVYPNPANDVFTVVLPASLSSMDLELMDVNGQVLKRQRIISTTSEVEVGDLPAGLYLISLRTDEVVIHHRIVVR